MYRLLIISDSNEKIENIKKFDQWYNLGYKNPHYRFDYNSTLEGLNKHHVDAIAIELDSEEESKKIKRYLDDNYPLLPLFKVLKGNVVNKDILLKLRKYLDKFNADFSDEFESDEERHKKLNKKFYSKYLNNRLDEYDDLEELNRMLRTKLLLTKPCFIADIGIKDGENYVTNEWKYAEEQLEQAISFVINNKEEGSGNYISVLVNPNLCRIMAGVYRDNEQNCEDILKTIESNVKEVLEESIDRLKTYLRLNDIYVINYNFFDNHKILFKHLKKENEDGITK